MAKPKKHFVGLLPAGESTDVDDDIALEEEGPAEQQLEALVKDEPIPKEQPVKEAVEKPARRTKATTARSEGDDTPPPAILDVQDQLRKENEELKLQQARWNERVAYAREIAAQTQATRAQEEQVRQQQEAQKAREAERPDPLVDPHGASMWDLQQQVLQQQAWIENFQRQTQQGQAVSYEQQIRADIDMKMNFAMSRHSDYMDAVSYLRKLHEDELVAIGITDEDMQNQQIQRKLFAFAEAARQNGIDIGEALYVQAARLGYSQVKPQQPKAAAKIDQLNRGRQLAGLGGQRPGVADREEEFDLGAWLETASESDVIAMQAKMGVSKFNQMLERLEMGPMQ